MQFSHTRIPHAVEALEQMFEKIFTATSQFHDYTLQGTRQLQTDCVSAAVARWKSHTHTHTHTHPFNGPYSGTTWVSQYQKGKTNLDFAEARDSVWQWHRLDHMQVCTSLQTDNHANTSLLQFFYRPDALPAAQPTASKH